MRKNILKSLTGTAAIAMVMGICACNDDLDPNDSTSIINNVSDTEATVGADPIASPLDETTVVATTSFIGNIPSDAATLLNKRFVNQASGFGADVIILPGDQLYSHQKEIKDAYEAGKIIIEVNAKGQIHNDFWNILGVTTYMDNDSTVTFMGMQQGSCFMTGNVSEIENHNLNILVEWANERLAKKNEDATRALSECASVEAKGETKAVTASSNAIDLQSLEGVQDINYDLELDIKNFTLCEVVWSDADRINRHGHIKVNLRVTPFHAFDIPKNGNFAGDYYFVQATVVSHNGDFYGIYSCSHGWVDTFAHALFCRRINFTAQLCNSYKEPYDSNLSFFQTPNPQTSANSVSYSSGFNFTLSVTGTGGYTQKPGWNLGGSFGGNWTWSDNKNETVSDQSIDMRTEEKTCKVNYTFWCNNWKEDDDQEIAIPRIARTDQTCKASWCWHREKVSDAVSIHTIPWAEWLHFTLRPTFAWIWRHKTWRCEGDYNEYTFKGLDEWAMLNPPDRVQYGTLSIQNNHTDDKVVTDLRIYYGDYKDGVYISLNDVLAKDATLNLTVPQGNYVIYYKVVDRNDIFNEPKWYRFDMVWVNPAEVCSVNTLHHLYEEIPPCER